MTGKKTSIGGYNMKTKRNIFSKVVALVMCAVIFAGFAPTQLQANQLPIFVTILAQDHELRPIRGAEFALLHNDLVVETQATDDLGLATFDHPFTRADRYNLSVQVVNADGWHSEQPIRLLIDFDTFFWGGTTSGVSHPLHHKHQDHQHSHLTQVCYNLQLEVQPMSMAEHLTRLKPLRPLRGRSQWFRFGLL